MVPVVHVGVQVVVITLLRRRRAIEPTRTDGLGAFIFLYIQVIRSIRQDKTKSFIFLCLLVLVRSSLFFLTRTSRLRYRGLTTANFQHPGHIYLAGSAGRPQRGLRMLQRMARGLSLIHI